MAKPEPAIRQPESTVIEYMTFSLLAQSLFSSSRSCRHLFSLIIYHLNEAPSTTVMSSEVSSVVACIFEMPYMESVLTSCPFLQTAFALIECSFLSCQLHGFLDFEGLEEVFLNPENLVVFHLA